MSIRSGGASDCHAYLSHSTSLVLFDVAPGILEWQGLYGAAISALHWPLVTGHWAL